MRKIVNKTKGRSFILSLAKIVWRLLAPLSPGFTATSFYARLFAASGIEYEELLDRLISLALERHERRRSLEY